MSGIIEFFTYAYLRELDGIDTGEKCLGPGTWHGTKGGIWEVGCDYGVTLGKSGAGFVKAAKTGDWRQDPCVFYCGIWKRTRRLIGKFKVRGKFDYHIPTAIVAVRGTTFTIDVADWYYLRGCLRGSNRSCGQNIYAEEDDRSRRTADNRNP